MTSIASRAAAASPTRPWPADRVEQWPIERLIPYANNPRLHNAADVERIAASIVKWGWTNPVLVDDQGVLIAGHGRVAVAASAARAAGLGGSAAPLSPTKHYQHPSVARWAGSALLVNRPTCKVMNLDLTDEEAAALVRLLRGTIDADRYPLSARVKTWQAIL